MKKLLLNRVYDIYEQPRLDIDKQYGFTDNLEDGVFTVSTLRDMKAYFWKYAGEIIEEPDVYTYETRFAAHHLIGKKVLYQAWMSEPDCLQEGICRGFSSLCSDKIQSTLTYPFDVTVFDENGRCKKDTSVYGIKEIKDAEVKESHSLDATTYTEENAEKSLHLIGKRVSFGFIISSGKRMSGVGKYVEKKLMGYPFMVKCYGSVYAASRITQVFCSKDFIDFIGDK